MTPLVEHGTQVQAVVARYPNEVQSLSAIDPRTQALLVANRSKPVSAVATALNELSTKLEVSPSRALDRLVAVGKVPEANLATLKAYGPEVAHASAVSPGEWRRWWWVCVGAEVVLVPFIFLMKGRWRPSIARRDEQAHDSELRCEDAAPLGGASGSGPGSSVGRNCDAYRAGRAMS
ncbi:MAG TPA: hypothetical protein VFW24_05350 [Acidimicrobiales bacterium]|nr:hypothetical protein [Acidimicrobiales bacterium]